MDAIESLVPTALILIETITLKVYNDVRSSPGAPRIAIIHYFQP